MASVTVQFDLQVAWRSQSMEHFVLGWLGKAVF